MGSSVLYWKVCGLRVREIWVKFYFRDSKQVLTSLKFIFLICGIVLLLLNICFSQPAPMAQVDKSLQPA